jgi:hypothetical protein
MLVKLRHAWISLGGLREEFAEVLAASRPITVTDFAGAMGVDAGTVVRLDGWWQPYAGVVPQSCCYPRNRRYYPPAKLPVILRVVSVQARRVLLTLVGVSVVAGLALPLAGCAKMDAALSQQWVDVSFKAGTPVAEVLRIRAACSHVPNVSAYPIPGHLPAIDVLASVRFNTTGASEANVVALETCISRFPAAVGFDPGDATDSGG